MSRRIDIELTSALDDGTWTWRAAGAKQPKGVLDGGILPAGAKVGDELKVEIDQQLDGVTVLSVVQGRQKHERDVLELLASEQDFQPVIETRAKHGRGERRSRDDRDGRRRRDRGDRPDGGRGGGRGDRGGRTDRDDRGGRGDRGDRGDRGGRGDGRRRHEGGRRGPSFTPPPEVPQRPKPKRLRPGKANRTAVLNDLPAEQRPIAELALQGMSAVRQRLREENERAVAEGRATMPEASVLKIAEDLLPRLRVAEWRDRAEAAKAQLEELDLRDLRSVVAAANDPMVARDDSTRPLVEELRAGLVSKQEQELHLWFGDVDAALAVGRVVRALRLSSQPPKAGVPFPADIAQRLVDSANASLAPMDSPERWIAMLEAAAFSPVRSQIRPARTPDTVSDELMATVKRLAPALPKVAELFEIEVDPKAPMPKPQRPGPRNRRPDGKTGSGKGGAGKGGGTRERSPKRPKQPAEAGKDVAKATAAEAAPAEATAPEAAPAEATAAEAAPAESAAPEVAAPAPAEQPAEPAAPEAAAAESVAPEVAAPAPAEQPAEPAAAEAAAPEAAVSEPAESAAPEAVAPDDAEPPTSG